MLNGSAAFITRYPQCRSFEHKVPGSGISTLYIRAGVQGMCCLFWQSCLGKSTHPEGGVELQNSLESSCLISKDHIIWAISVLPFFVENLFSYCQCIKEIFKNAQARGKKGPTKKKLKIREEMGKSGGFNSSFSYLDRKNAVFR